MVHVRALAIAIAALIASASPALANDSEAEIGLDGIVLLKQSDAIVMESEDLFISEQRVRVAYRMRNPTNGDIATTVAFPLPRQPRGLLDRMIDGEEREDYAGFDFATKINGAPVRLTHIERAMIGERDVTQRLRELGLPLFWPSKPDLVATLSETRQAALLAEGLLVRNDPAYGSGVVPAWDMATYFVRDQIFPANTTITVEHEYAPMAGGSVGGALYPSVRKDTPEIETEYRKEYCTDAAFLSGLDRRLNTGKPGSFTNYAETWIGYVLTSGANWNGPIRDFRLVVDKGAPENLVSFCMDGVKKISPTRFEVRKRDFVPRRDLSILIAKFYNMDQ